MRYLLALVVIVATALVGRAAIKEPELEAEQPPVEGLDESVWGNTLKN